jgi:hypothetical protein
MAQPGDLDLTEMTRGSENAMNANGNEPKISRKQWLTCFLVACAVFALNHLYWMDSGRFYPIVVWGAPLFSLVGLTGVIYPNVNQRPPLLIGMGAVGLVLGICAHSWIYGF